MQTVNNQLPHRRLNPLTNEWVLISPQRGDRPWHGQVENVKSDEMLQYDPTCYFCPGNTRNNGVVNPQYNQTYVFVNDTPAILPVKNWHTSKDQKPIPTIFVDETVSGICEVICYTPDHNKTMASMVTSELLHIIEAWQQRYKQLGSRKDVSYVQIFENKGAVMGCSQPHPHGQIWSMSFIPNEAAKELTNQSIYFDQHKSPLLIDYVTQEIKKKERILFSNNSFTVLIPYWAIWPFQTMIIPNTQVASIDQLNSEQQSDLAEALSLLTKTYDRVFNVSFPYSMGIHQAPTDGKIYNFQTMHFEFYPALLRSATVKKHMVGFEMMALPQRDLTPELAAKKLRDSLPI